MRKFLATRKASSKLGAPRLHEITPFHLHAAALPDRFAPSRGDPHPDPFPYSKTKTGTALETDRPGEADAGHLPIAYSVRETDANSQA
jgi:hypothetical protein